MGHRRLAWILDVEPREEEEAQSPVLVMKPPMLVQHLVVMAAVRRVPVVALGIDSVALGEILGLKRLLVLAVRKGEATTGGSLSEFLARHGTLPIVPWATGTASQQPIRAASAVKLRPRRRA